MDFKEFLLIIFACSFVIGNPAERFKRIVGGAIPENPNDFGHVATLFLNNSVQNIPFCGASHIGGGWLVSAAHCVKHMNRSKILVRFGASDLSLPAPFHQVQDIIICDPKAPYLFRDLVLLKFENFSTIPSVQLPAQNFRFNEIKQCEVAGFGSDKYNGGIQDKMHVAPIGFVPFSRCRRKLGYLIIESDLGSVLCAGGKTTDTCQGDSGTGIVCNGNVLVGITSYGQNCGVGGFPAVYTNVKFYANWIRGIIANYKD